MKHYQLIIFDWEGTLGDSIGVLLRHLKTVVTNMGLPPFDDNEARKLIRLDFHQMLSTLYQDLASHEILALKARFRQYHLRAEEEAMLYPGARALLANLDSQKKLLAIATSKSERGLALALEATGLASFFFAKRTPQQCACKPAPAMTEELIELAGVSKDETVVVGDSVGDMQMALNAEVDAIGINVSTFAPVDELANTGALAVVNSYDELSKLLSS
jgi:phosphoglycolate phosphatase